MPEQDPEPVEITGEEPQTGSAAIAWVRRQLEPLAADRLTLFSGLVAAVTLTASRYHLSTGEYRRIFGAPSTPDIAEHLYWFVGSFALFFVLPLSLARLFRIDWRALGTGLGDVRYGLKATALLYLVMLPFVVGAAFSPAFASHYPMSGGASASLRTLVGYELAYASYFVGWEFVFRGLLCVALFPRLGGAALVLQTIPFAVMHAGKPEAEAYGSIVAGLALGALAVRARSFWYGALLHAAVATTMDLAALATSHRLPKLP